MTDRIAFGLLALALPCLLGLVNPSFQPADLVGRYQTIVTAEVVSIGDDDTLTLRVTEVLKGTFDEQRITLAFPPPDATAGADTQPLIDRTSEGEAVLVMLGARRQPGAAMIYGSPYWDTAEVVDDVDEPWAWQECMGDQMWGTFNGDTSQLIRLVRDELAEKAFFPAEPFVGFKPERVVGELPGAVHGVALVDLDDNDRLDIVAASSTGVRVYLQQDAMQFEDRTADLALADVTARSIGVGDVDGDGRPDLLLDATLYQQTDRGFTSGDELVDLEAGQLHQAGFVEINGDGRPDVVLSVKGEGLRLLLNKGDGSFTDAGSSWALDEETAQADGTGYFTPGDWDGDGRTDLFFAAGDGALLVQDEKTFQPVEHDVRFDFRPLNDSQPGLTGAGSMMPQWSPERLDLVVPGDERFWVVTRRDGRAVDVTGHGNEIKVAGSAQLATLVEDLNMDGRPDLYTISREGGSVFHAYRGYGSYMRSSLYASGDLFPGDAHDRAAGGLAAGDVDGDGANDLVIGGQDGRVVLLLNDALNRREPVEHPRRQERVLQQVGYLTVRVPAQHAVGATVDVESVDEGELAARRPIGTQLLTGSRGPGQTTIALREPGDYVVNVKTPDGNVQRLPVTVRPREHRVITAAEASSKR